jgi:hypothetical protein
MIATANLPRHLAGKPAGQPASRLLKNSVIAFGY